MTSSRPLRVGVAELRRRLGTRKHFRERVLLDDLAISTASVPPDGQIDVDLDLESISSGLVVEGTVRAPWTGDCRRCLEPIEGVVEAKVKEIFEPDPTEGETYRLLDDQVDLEPMVRDAVLLALPLAPLCGPDCEGPSPDAFPTGQGDESPTGRGGQGVSNRPRDERWAVLDELRFEEENGSG